MQVLSGRGATPAARCATSGSEHTAHGDDDHGDEEQHGQHNAHRCRGAPELSGTEAGAAGAGTSTASAAENSKVGPNWSAKPPRKPRAGLQSSGSLCARSGRRAAQWQTHRYRSGRIPGQCQNHSAEAGAAGAGTSTASAAENSKVGPNWSAKPPRKPGAGLQSSGSLCARSGRRAAQWQTHRYRSGKIPGQCQDHSAVVDLPDVARSLAQPE